MCVACGKTEKPSEPAVGNTGIDVIAPSEVAVAEDMFPSCRTSQSQTVVPCDFSWTGVAGGYNGEIFRFWEPGTATLIARSTASGATGTKQIVVRPWTVTVAPATKTLANGQSVELQATITDHRGNAVNKPWVVFWSVPASAPVTVSPTSANTAALAPGKTTATAKATGTGTAVVTATASYDSPKPAGSGTAVVTVNAASLSVTTGTTTFSATVGNSTIIVVTVVDAQGNAVTSPVLTFSTSGNYTVLSSTATSVVVRPLAVGTFSFTITATANGASGSTTVTLIGTAVPPVTAFLLGAGIGTPIGGTRQMLALLPNGSLFLFTAPLAGISTSATAPWANQLATGFTSSNPAVATVSSTGLITGVSAGTTTITGQWSTGGSDYSGSITETVGPLDSTAPQSTSISSLPGMPIDIRVGRITAFRCAGTTASGASIVANATWTTSNAAVATVSSAGVITGVAPGTATIGCTINGRTASMSTTVTP